jgi:hypothetical protein
MWHRRSVPEAVANFTGSSHTTRHLPSRLSTQHVDLYVDPVCSLAALQRFFEMGLQDRYG